MPIFSVPMLERDLLPLWNEPAPASGLLKDHSREWLAADHEGRLDPIARTITALTASEAADLAEARYPQYQALRDLITVLYQTDGLGFTWG